VLIYALHQNFPEILTEQRNTDIMSCISPLMIMAYLPSIWAQHHYLAG